MHQHVSTGWARKLMDYGKMGHGAGWQPGKDAEVVGLGGGEGHVVAGDGGSGGGEGGGAAAHLHSQCLSFVAVIAVVGVIVAVVVVVVVVVSSRKKKERKKRAEQDDDVTDGAQLAGKQLSHFGSRSTFLASASGRRRCHLSGNPSDS